MCYTSLIHVDTRRLYGHAVTLNIINRDELSRIPGLRRLCKPVLQIYDILVWIRIWIRASMTLNNGSGSRFGSGSCCFRHWSSRWQQKTNFKKSFSAYYFFKVHLHHFSKIKSQKRSHKAVGIKIFLTTFASWQKDPDPDPEGQNIYGSATLV